MMTRRKMRDRAMTPSLALLIFLFELRLFVEWLASMLRHDGLFSRIEKRLSLTLKSRERENLGRNQEQQHNAADPSRETCGACAVCGGELQAQLHERHSRFPFEHAAAKTPRHRLGSTSFRSACSKFLYEQPIELPQFRHL